LAQSMKRVAKASHVAFCFSEVFHSNERVGRELWELCKESLAAKLSLDGDALCATANIKNIHWACPDIGGQLCDLLNIEEVAENVNNTANSMTMVSCVLAVLQSNEQVGLELWRLCKESLAAVVSCGKNLLNDSFSVGDLRSHCPHCARELCDSLNVAELAEIIKQRVNFFEAAQCVVEVLHSNELVGRKLWQLCKENLATAVHYDKNLRLATHFVRDIGLHSPDMAREFCDLLDIEKLVENIKQTANPWDIAQCILTVLRSNEQVGREFWRLSKEGLAIRVSRAKDISGGTGCITDIHSHSPDMAHELCDLLDVEELVSRINRGQHPWRIYECVSAVLASNEEVGRKIWELFKRSFAGRMSCGKDILRGASCISVTHSHSPDMAHELYQMLDLDELVLALRKHTGKYQERFLRWIAIPNDQVHERFLNLLQRYPTTSGIRKVN